MNSRYPHTNTTPETGNLIKKITRNHPRDGAMTRKGNTPEDISTP